MHDEADHDFLVPARAESPDVAVKSDAVIRRLRQELGHLPDSRAAEVERARQLLEDPDYPSPEVMRQVARILAARLDATREDRRRD